MSRIRIILTAAFAACISVGSALANDLPRRIWHGMGMEPADGGMKITQLVPEATAATAGLQVGDLLTSLDGLSVAGGDERTLEMIRKMISGRPTTYQVRRDGAVLTLTTTGKPIADETPPQGVVQQYGAVPFQGGQLRSLVSRPERAAGRLPAILFVQGYPCTSYIDINPQHPYRRLVAQFVEAGFIVMRVDKPQVGDGLGGPRCDEMDLKTEAAAFKAALDALQARSDVASDQVFIFGHSLGGIIAPLIADGENLRGVAAYGTNALPWFEYFLQLIRVQGSNSSPDMQMLESDMRSLHHALYHMMVLQKTPADVANLDAAWGEALKRNFGWDGQSRKIFGRDVATYWDLNAINLPQAWVKAAPPTLILHGEADMEVMSDEGPRAIVRLINQTHRDRARFCTFVGVNHSFAQVGSLRAEFEGRTKPDYVQRVLANYDPRPGAEIVTWFQEQLGKQRSQPSACSP